MCGIAGVLYFDRARQPSRRLLERMGDAISHRGPDAEGFLIEPGIGLVHRRLAIVDLGGGDQPIGNEDGSVNVVFNGEIYNFRVLSGDGGDEAFGGYARYAHDLREAALRGALPDWFRRSLIGPLSRRWPTANWLPRPVRLRSLLENLACPSDGAYANTLARCREPLRSRLISADLALTPGDLSGELRIRAAFRSAPPSDPLAGMIAADAATALPDDFLVKVDRASMACGLELRPPLLDHELIELAARIPSRWKVRHGEGKWIFKQAFRDLLPTSARTRPKQGFDLPIDDWLRGPLSAMFCDVVLSPTSAVSGLINQPLARQLYRSHRRGFGRHGNVLWTLLVLARWADRFLRPEPLATRPALPLRKPLQPTRLSRRAV